MSLNSSLVFLKEGQIELSKLKDKMKCILNRFNIESVLKLAFRVMKNKDVVMYEKIVNMSFVNSTVF